MTTPSFKYHLGCFPATLLELSSWNRVGIALKVKNIYYLCFTENVSDLCARALLRTFSYLPSLFCGWVGRHLRLPSPVMAGWMNVAFLWAQLHTRTKSSSWQTDIFLHQN